MIDINELRRLAQAATPGPDGVSLNWLKLLQDFQKEANPAVINELLDRLEAAESARRDDYQNWMTALDRNAELLAKLEAAEKERDVLKAKIECMEKRLRLILEEPENTMSNSKAMREMLRQARLALEESK